MPRANLLLVEDDELLGATISENLNLEGYHTVWIKNGVEAESALKNSIFDLLILDLMIPGKSGLELLREIRRSSDIPVLIISAKNSPEDRIQGLELKADDYLDKPFHLKEFLLRVARLVERQKVRHQKAFSKQVRIGEAEFDFDQMLVKQGNKREKLSEKEAAFLSLLLARRNNVVSRDEILDQIWGREKFPTTRTIDNFIVKFRRWVELDPSQPEFIVSQRGVGYLLRLNDDDRGIDE